MNEFIQQFQTIVQRHPLQSAISTGSGEITYSKLEQYARDLACRLHSRGIGPGHLVAINIEKSAEYLIALLAIWMTDAAFVPIDPTLPSSRQHFILAQSKPNIILHNAFKMDVIHHDTAYVSDLAYIFFTSGSTGNPKGVMVSHAGIVNVLNQQIKLFQIHVNSRSLFYLSTNFDASISDIGTALLSGATLCLAKESSQSASLSVLLEKNNITHLDLPPSLLPMLDMEPIPSKLETIIIGGEVCPVDVIQRWAKKCRLIHIYGPTEATICTSMQRCTEHWNAPSIGCPIANISYHIFNEQGQSVSEGELHISGVGLALGYVNDVVMTQKKFITIDLQQFYCTGDWVKRTADGDYIYLGRMDRQLKIRGLLIAPEEIEASLHRHPLVTGAAVIGQTSQQRKRLIAIVESSGITAHQLNYFLKETLPSWMIPHQIILTTTIPKNINWKIDYQQLESMDFSIQKVNVNSLNSVVAPSTSTILQLICKNLLELTTLPSVDDDLMDDLGADSFDILQIITQSASEGIYFSIGIVGQLRTINALTRWSQSNDSQLPPDAMHASTLRRECTLDHSLTLVAQIEPCGTMTKTEILLTGSTGFLGIHVLDELLQQTEANITCLIRGENKTDALQRIIHTAHFYGIQMNPLTNRISIVIGDITAPQLGLSSSDWNELSHTTTDIYHCAADVNMVKSYEALKPTNIYGTKEIARLASTATQKRLYYASTLSVFAGTDQNSGVCQENDTLDKTQYVYGGYAQSKWMAEYHLQHSSLDVTLFRLGLITGNSHQPRFPVHDYLSMVVKGLQKIGSVPKGDWDSIQLDATPVDYAAKALVYLSLHAQASCYHLVNTSGFSLAMIITAMGKQGVALDIKDPQSWTNNVNQDAHTAAASMALCRLLNHEDRYNNYRSMDLFQATGVTFDQSNTKKGLSQSNITCPQADEHLLNKYIQRILHG